MNETRTIDVVSFEPLVLKSYKDGDGSCFVEILEGEGGVTVLTCLNDTEVRELINALQELIGDKPAQQKTRYEARPGVGLGLRSIGGGGQPVVIETAFKEVETKVAECRTYEDAQRIAEAMNSKGEKN